MSSIDDVLTAEQHALMDRVRFALRAQHNETCVLQEHRPLPSETLVPSAPQDNLFLAKRREFVK